MKKLKCSRCKRVFGSAGALRTHELYSKRCGSREQEKVPAAPRVPTPSAIPRRKKWDPSWSDAVKEIHLLESSAYEWGIERRHGKWQVVPVPGGMTYPAAVIAADKRNTIDRLMPPVRRVRRVQDEDTEDLVLGLLLLELIK